MRSAGFGKRFELRLGRSGARSFPELGLDRVQLPNAVIAEVGPGTQVSDFATYRASGFKSGKRAWFCGI
jgi:hypothetical protein